ncbi:MAG: HflK protein, partial [Deltaproteobacteria bacterium]|nr:HflK protein [Deltaproteobacteria bacterium]
MAWDWEKLQQQKKSMGGGGTPPQLDDVLEKLKGMGNKFPGIWIIVVILVLIYLGSSMVYTVGTNERGIIQQFGKHVRTTVPGIHAKWPRGIEKVTKVKVDYVFKEEFG